MALQLAKSHPPIIGIVGVCASGKTTLTRRLTQLGLDTHHIAQEHSYVPDMWQRLTHPDFLIYLMASYASTIRRRKLNWTQSEYEEQLFRLRHAREHANLVIDTDSMTETGLVTFVVNFLRQHKFLP